MPEPILTTLAIPVMSLTDISKKQIQFFNFENFIQNEMLKFDSKAILLTQENERHCLLVLQKNLVNFGKVMFSSQTILMA
jgi:hypothetical protein